jgi:hypothetical protein
MRSRVSITAAIGILLLASACALFGPAAALAGNGAGEPVQQTYTIKDCAKHIEMEKGTIFKVIVDEEDYGKFYQREKEEVSSGLTLLSYSNPGQPSHGIRTLQFRADRAGDQWYQYGYKVPYYKEHHLYRWNFDVS